MDVDLSQVNFSEFSSALVLEQRFQSILSQVNGLRNTVPTMIGELDAIIAGATELGVDVTRYTAMREAINSGMGAAIAALEEVG